MLDVIHGTTEKPVSTGQIIDLLKANIPEEIEGYIYVGYPILSTSIGGLSLDVVLVSSVHGVVVFDLIEGTAMEDHSAERDSIYLSTKSRLIQNPTLMKGRELGVGLNVVTYAPSVKNIPVTDEFFNNDDALLAYLSKVATTENTPFFRPLTSVIQTVTKLSNSKKRVVKKENSRGAKLKKLEASIANLDSRQNKAVIETVAGPQRIRGLAGSGKTIILALKAAYLHARYPEWKIIVTYNTRSLKEQFVELITKFTIEQKGEEPNWDNLKVVQAWGSSSSMGVYYDFCISNAVDFYDYRTALFKFGRTYPFANAVNDALKQLVDKNITPIEKYDAILIDEAQDFSAPFLRLCYKFLKAPKRIIWAYDELQNLNITQIRSPHDLFGVNLNNGTGEPQQDIILNRCYRNSRPVLVTAHGLGFGTGRPELVQMFDEHHLWLDIGYEIEEGDFVPGEKVVLKRSVEASPKFLEDHSPLEDLLIFKSFKNQIEQADWVAKSIINDLTEEELTHRDIIVIQLDPLHTKDETALIRSKLFEKGINAHVAGITTTSDQFMMPESIAFTGIYRAKGNEAPMVYIINAEYAYSGPELIKKRNMLFSALTRSKAWVRVTGCGKNMDQLIAEYQKIKDADFKLSFVYPTPEEMEKLRVIHRDMTLTEARKIEKTDKGLAEILKELKEGKIKKEDLPQLEVLKNYLRENE